MKEIKHLDLSVDSDMLKLAEFDGTLEEYAAKMLNEILYERPGFHSVINIESTKSSSEIKDNPERYRMKYRVELSVWYYEEY